MNSNNDNFNNGNNQDDDDRLNQGGTLYTDFFESETDIEQFQTISPFPEQNPVDEQTEQDEAMLKKRRRRLIIIMCGAALALLLFFYFWGVVYFRSHFLPRTDINGIPVGRQTVKEATQTLEKSLESREVAIIGKNNMQDLVTGSAIGLKFENDLGDLQALMQNQKVLLWPYEVFTHKESNLNTDYVYDEDKLKQTVENLTLVSGPDVVAPQNAAIVYNGSQFTIQPAVDGNQPDVPKLEEAVANALVDDEPEIELSNGFYLMPEVGTDNPTLNDVLNQYNTAIKAVITLTFPTEQVVLNKDTFAGWLTVNENNAATLNPNDLNAYVAQLAARFDNNGRDLSFTANNGATYTFRYNSGWVLDQTQEAQQLQSQILSGTVITEEPTWAQRGNNFITGNTVGGTYIEASLGSQMIWYYRNGSLVTSSTMVSGDVKAGEATATGLYFLTSKDTNVNLYVRVPNGQSGNMQVKYWLPYSAHYGIESAPWRQTFGGDIYRTQGTDGDLDVPEDMARALYNSCDVGTPVVIY